MYICIYEVGNLCIPASHGDTSISKCFCHVSGHMIVSSCFFDADARTLTAVTHGPTQLGGWWDVLRQRQTCGLIFLHGVLSFTWPSRLSNLSPSWALHVHVAFWLQVLIGEGNRNHSYIFPEDMQPLLSSVWNSASVAWTTNQSIILQSRLSARVVRQSSDHTTYLYTSNQYICICIYTYICIWSERWYHLRSRPAQTNATNGANPVSRASAAVLTIPFDWSVQSHCCEAILRSWVSYPFTVWELAPMGPCLTCWHVMWYLLQTGSMRRT